MQILVIDNEEGIRIGLQLALENSHEVRTAASATEGIKAIQQALPDCILLDMFMQEESGEQVRTFLYKKRGWDRFEVGHLQKIVSGHGGSINVTSALGEGTTFFVGLPVQQANLRRIGLISGISGDTIPNSELSIVSPDSIGKPHARKKRLKNKYRTKFIV